MSKNKNQISVLNKKLYYQRTLFWKTEEFQQGNEKADVYFDVRTSWTSKCMSTARRDKCGREKRDETRQEVQTVPREIMTVNVCITVDPAVV